MSGKLNRIPYFLPPSITAMMIAAVVTILLNTLAPIPRMFPGYGDFSFHLIEGASFGWPFAAFEYSLWDNSTESILFIDDVVIGVAIIFVVGRISDRVAHSRAATPGVSGGKKQRWFQFHLSTAIVLTLLAGALGLVQAWPEHYMMEFGNTTNWACGWPMPILKWWTGPGGTARLSQAVFPPGVAVNIATAVLILATVARVLERRISSSRQEF